MILNPENINAGNLLMSRTGDLPLGEWYAEPLSGAVAVALRQQAHRALRQVYANGMDSYCARLQEFIAEFWLGRSVVTTHRTLALIARNGHQRALADLVFGQLLISRKCTGGRAWLDSGFGKAANLFGAEEYFRVLKRHTVLRAIVLGDQPSSPQSLASLLKEAQVISRLTESDRKSGCTCWSPEDTLG